MRKLKLCVLDRLIHLYGKRQLSKYETLFIIYISQYQDNRGRVHGVYYKDICKALNISIQKFYDLKRSLEAKGVIRVIKCDYTDWDIQIIDNDFTYPESFNEGYINMSHNIFQHEDFFNLKAGAMLLAMQFMKISYSGRGSYNIGTDKFYEKYTELLGVTKRVIQNYMTALRKFFSIGIKNKQFWITPLTKVYKGIGAASDAEVYREHIGKVVCRRSRIQFNSKSFRDTIDLMKQYGQQLKDQTADIFMSAVKQSLEKANENQKNKSKWTRILQPKLVHKMLREQILQPEH